MKKGMDIKDKTAYVTAILSFVIGWGLTIAGFIIEPKGEVSGSVLAVLGEALVYTAGVLGVTMYVKHSMERLRHDTRQYVRTLEREEMEESNGD